ncbi:MAG TPA: MmgE/PrpD family protein [Burkholderiales bacterium]|jgi:2-methylcitrate dehydratase PrpD|nr:MmgE/PrpD family protein [Burkholderiales bacterium]
MANAYTRAMAEFVAGLQYRAIPSEVRERIKLLILDALGCALYGARLEWCRILHGTLSQVDGGESCVVWGTGRRLTAPHAALANGTQVQGFELDDVHRAGVLHVGAVVLPALIAVAELRRNLSGSEFLAAAVAGYEIGPRVGLCMGPEHIGQGWHSGATVGVFSAAAAASRGLNLNSERTIHALGIAGTQAAGLMAAQYGAMVKRMHAGRASQSGLYGALLAEQGFTGIEDVFESEYGGFCTTFSRSRDRFDLGQLTAGLGEIWQTMGVALKFYACVGSNHTTLDALQEIRRRRPFEAGQVEKIVVHGSQATADHVGWKYEPRSLTAAQLNLPFCAATLLLEGDCSVDQFTEGAVADPARIALANRVEVIAEPQITAKGASFRHLVRVTVRLRGGERLECTKEAPRGSERDFASAAEITHKYEQLARHALPEGRVAELRDAVLGLESLSDAASIATLMFNSKEER